MLIGRVIQVGHSTTHLFVSFVGHRLHALRLLLWRWCRLIGGRSTTGPLRRQFAVTAAARHSPHRTRRPALRRRRALADDLRGRGGGGRLRQDGYLRRRNGCLQEREGEREMRLVAAFVVSAQHSHLLWVRCVGRQSAATVRCSARSAARSRQRSRTDCRYTGEPRRRPEIGPLKCSLAAAAAAAAVVPDSIHRGFESAGR